MPRRLVLVAVVLLVAAAARGQERPVRCAARGVPVSLALGWLAYHEEGVDGLDGATMIHEAIGTLAAYHGISWTESACRYSDRLFAGRTERAPWILRLDRSGEAPRGWPRTTSWEVAGPQWSALLDHTEAIERGEVEPVCSEPVSDWGDAHVDGDRIARGIARGFWRRVDCGPNVRNVGLRREHLDPDPE